MKTYGIYKTTIINHHARNLIISSGYDLEKARSRCAELNRVQTPKNTERMRVFYYVFQEFNK